MTTPRVCSQVAKELMTWLTENKAPEWVAFQSSAQQLKLKRSELMRTLEDLATQQAASGAKSAYELASDEEEEGAADRAAAVFATQGRTKPVRIVLITGFESFNQQLYKKAAQKVPPRCALRCVSVGESRGYGNIVTILFTNKQP